MAASTGLSRERVSADAELLQHPELLSLDCVKLILKERNVSTRECGSRDRLMELYLRHVIPLPQRTLPSSRWGRRMEKSRGRRASAGHSSESSSNDHNRKRPLIVYDGSSSFAALLKVKKPESTGLTERLKPPPAANLSNPIRKLSSSSSSSSSSSMHHSSEKGNLKRAESASGEPKSPEVKKKIQHVTWP